MSIHYFADKVYPISRAHGDFKRQTRTSFAVGGLQQHNVFHATLCAVATDPKLSFLLDAGSEQTGGRVCVQVLQRNGVFSYTHAH